MPLFSKSHFECDPTNQQYLKRKTREEKETKDQTQGRSTGDIQEERQGDPDMTSEQGLKRLG